MPALSSLLWWRLPCAQIVARTDPQFPCNIASQAFIVWQSPDTTILKPPARSRTACTRPGNSRKDLVRDNTGKMKQYLTQIKKIARFKNRTCCILLQEETSPLQVERSSLHPLFCKYLQQLAESHGTNPYTAPVASQAETCAKSSSRRPVIYADASSATLIRPSPMTVGTAAWSGGAVASVRDGTLFHAPAASVATIGSWMSKASGAARQGRLLR